VKQETIADTRTGCSSPTAYLAYFDYQRRKNPEFRRNLRRNERRQARAEKEEAEATTQRQRQVIKARVDEAKETGFPSGVEEREAFFNEQVMTGEMLSSDRTYTILQAKCHLPDCHTPTTL
jgi:mitochondrial import receptor subunit TOM20